ncbi:hypothetical protein MANES_11G060215v8 [Manihot esculenta]|uniref:Uncharacterized protein n=1 Tax=Manihot esculenta TaxID=3983 RepID=A0ACB7GW16_MANES|nr:hypothetical protein MANES_11G060215v8 [Manihot esculenta]
MELANIAKCLLLGVVILWIQIHGNKGCFEEERLALLDFKAFVGSNGFDTDHLLPSWIDDTTSNCCEWERVICNSTTGHVTELLLNNTRQYNIESSSFYNDNLNNLQFLDISDNNFNGTLSFKDFSTFKRLETLNLGGNAFTGCIPEDMWAPPSLKALYLYGNKLSGSLLKQSKFTERIEYLDLSYNSFSGLLPSCSNQLKELKTLNLSYNHFDGSIDNQGLCVLKSLVELHLQGNRLSGPLPECIGNFTNLQFLDLSFNQLSGNIQSIVSELTSLKYLLLHGNEFEGSFSFSALANHSKLEVFILSPGNSRLEVETENPTWFPAFQLKYIQLSNCSLNVRTRAIPSFLHYQYDIRFIDLSHNTLVGAFPTWILQNNSNLGVINLRNNSFTGTFQLPNFKHDLVQLDISSNNLTGMLPKEFGLVLPRLEYINMSRNNFGGNVPSSISKTPELSILDLSHNNFSGELPGSLFANCTMYCALILSNNNFQGNVFPQGMNLRSMTVLDMKNNNFSAMVGRGSVRSVFSV